MNATTETQVMRDRAEWMAPADDVILEILEDKGNLTPKSINEQGGPTPNYIVNRCSDLSTYGLVEKIGHGLYRITERGEAYLAGEIDAGQLEPVE